MTNINILILQALKDIGVPVFFQEADEGADYPYITFFEYNNSPTDFSDDKEDTRTHYIQVDIWTRGSYIQLAKNVEKALAEVDVSYTNGRDLYEKDVKVYHKAMRFTYLEERNDINE